MNMTYRLPVLVVILTLTFAPGLQAQNYINQSALAEILTPCNPDLASKPEVHYEYFQLYNSRGNSVLARNTLYHLLGDGDAQVGKKRAKLVGLLNRRIISFTQVGDRLVIPTRFDDDFCVYAPFPRFYEGASTLGKLFVIDKSIQAFAAYENGRLVRWGIVNTGAKTSPTPNGRFNFNWRTEYRISSLSPPGEDWEMYWVFNFVQDRGIHIHQYPMPTGGPTSHGCVRMVEEDAKFIYDWADPWKTTSGSGIAPPNARVVSPGTTVIIIGDDPNGEPEPFIHSAQFPTLVKVQLPSNPFDVPPGTEQQRHFDRLNKSE